MNMINETTYKYVIIDDEPNVRRDTIHKIDSLNLPLEYLGEASNGKEGLELIEKVVPNLVITDISMPVCDGFEVVKNLNFQHPNIFVIVMSEYETFAFAKVAIQNRVLDYIVKPARKEELAESLQSAVSLFDARTQKIRKFERGKHNLSQEEIFHFIVNYIQKNYDKEISIGTIAEDMGFTQEYLGKVFKKYSNMSPIKYLALLRMNHAKELLIQYPDLEVNKVGEMTGYKDPYYFSRVFKNCTGVSPSDFREKYA